MKLLRTLIPALALLVGVARADTPVSGDISTNTTWDVAGSPYVIQDHTYITANSVLTVDPGVTVAFNGFFLLRVEAGSSIHAVGAPAQAILFTSNLPSPAAGDWNRVSALSSPASSFDYCIFEYGTRALEVDGSELTMSNCTFRFASQYGLLVKECSPSILNCNFYGNPTGLYVGDTTQMTSPIINGCNFHDNTLYCLYLAGFASPPLVTINAEGNWWGTDVASEIEAEIRHDIDDPATYAHVDCDPWLTTTAIEDATWARIKAMYAE